MDEQTERQPKRENQIRIQSETVGRKMERRVGKNETWMIL